MLVSHCVSVMLLFSAIALSFMHQYMIVEAATNVTTSFGYYACEKTSSSRCISASIQASTPSFDTLSFSSYSESGTIVDLGTTLKIDIKVIYSRARVFFVKDSRVIYNKYELFEPSLSCGVTPMSKCFDGTSTNFVLCCLNGKRGSGVFCLKEEEPSSYSGLRRAYQVYRMVNSQFSYQIRMKISQNGRSRDFTFNEDNTIASSSNVQASIFYVPPDEQATLFAKLHKVTDGYVLLRMMHLGTSSAYNQIQPSEVLLVEKLSNFLTDRYIYQMKSLCSTEYGQATLTHTDSDNKNDQFYNSETLYGVKNVLNAKLEIPNTDTITFGNTVGDESGVDYFEFDINMPLVFLDLLIKNIYDI